MTAYLALPLTFLKFWYVDSLIGLTQYFASLNQAFLQLFSIPLLLKTFFKPLKNEYREGLVGFSMGMGIVVKTGLLFIDVLLFFFLFFIEAVITLFFLSMPLLTIFVLFYQK